MANASVVVPILHTWVFLHDLWYLLGEVAIVSKTWNEYPSGTISCEEQAVTYTLIHFKLVLFCRDIWIICLVIIQKLAETVFTSLPFRKFWLNWLNVFRKTFGPLQKKQPSRHNSNGDASPWSAFVARASAFVGRLICICSTVSVTPLTSGLTPKQPVLHWMKFADFSQYASTFLCDYKNRTASCTCEKLFNLLTCYWSFVDISSTIPWWETKRRKSIQRAIEWSAVPADRVRTTVENT